MSPVISNKHHLYLNDVEIERLTIPENITAIGNYAFYGCGYFTSITMSNNLAIIGEGAFGGCENVESLNLPNNLQIIKKTAFQRCYNLKSITIPASVEFIYQESFANCDGLDSVKVLAETPPFLYDNSFSNYSIQLKVPKGCKETYQTAQGCKNFTNITDVDKYKLIYLIDNKEYKLYEVEEGEKITPEPAPTKEGYTFSGWSEIPETMPAHDVTVTGTFTVNQYKLTYMVDGVEYKSYEIDYGTTITPETEPTKEGYTFSGWSEIPETMPAEDVTVTGTFTINQYKLTYMIDDKVYKEVEYDYGATIVPEQRPDDEEYISFEWVGLPETMPAHDVTVYASYETGIRDVLMQQNVLRIYNSNGIVTDRPQKGLNIIQMSDGSTRKVLVK